jgi:hypothetical protein
MAGEMGGLMGTVIFRAKDAPRYIPGVLNRIPTPSDAYLNCLTGLVASLVSQGVLLLMLFGTAVHFFRQNRLIKAGKVAEGQTGFYYTL